MLLPTYPDVSHHLIRFALLFNGAKSNVSKGVLCLKGGDFAGDLIGSPNVREDPVTRTRFFRGPCGEAKTVRFGWLPGKDQKWAARRDWICRKLKKDFKLYKQCPDFTIGYLQLLET